ncbi:MAG: phosphomannomutase/phosphoglucomutase [Actinobacteria bacterium]|uniref:Phosphomannomutase/phosphoglucomutase n=1 Tax=Candidatus Fonsibacter lacus TaxID=2576439 RepID=A0A965LL75_9PROT|nr:phosphomannomutase/phosphoglucomutase [Candidatus Fonsibacter lacus]
MPYTDDSLASVIKSYDIRGLVGSEITEEFCRDIGVAFANLVSSKEIVVGYDMRPSSENLVAAFSDGVRVTGTNVVNIGLAATDQLYFATGKLNIPGAMFTASHNPAQYHGIKLARAGAKPIGSESGLAEIRKALIDNNLPTSSTHGVERKIELLEEYGAHLRSLVDCSDIRRLKVVIDAGNGMAGHTVPRVLGPLNLTIVPMYFELDGTFPNHEANPLDSSTLKDLQHRVVSEGADVGLAFDGDADRCFLVDESGDLVAPSLLTALIAESELAKAPGSTIIYSLISSRIVPEVIKQWGGVASRSKVGHSNIKAQMAETGAIFGGEHSGHFYFRDFWNADSGMLAALYALAALGHSTDSTLFSEIIGKYRKYSGSGEINSKVSDVIASMNRVENHFSGEGEVDRLDGLTISSGRWWLNVRPSNTEPLLRLNVEADNDEIMCAIRDAALEVIRQ